MPRSRGLWVRVERVSKRRGKAGCLAHRASQVKATTQEMHHHHPPDSLRLRQCRCRPLLFQESLVSRSPFWVRGRTMSTRPEDMESESVLEQQAMTSWGTQLSPILVLLLCADTKIRRFRVLSSCQLSHMHCNPDCIQRSCVNTYREPPKRQISALMTGPQYNNPRVICIGQDQRASAGWRTNTTTDRDVSGGCSPERPNETSVFPPQSQWFPTYVMKRLSVSVLHVWTDRWGEPPL